MKGHPRRIAPHQHAREAQFPLHHDSALDIVAEADAVGGVAKPIRPIGAVRVALRTGLLKPCDGFLTALRNADTELVGAAEGELPFHPTLLRAGLVEFRREVPVLVDALGYFVKQADLVKRFRLALCRSLAIPAECIFG